MSARVLHSACPLDCPDACDLEVTVDAAGRLARVDGGRRGPLTQGFVCTKVRNIARYVYAPDRVATPLLRDGPKGSGRFRPASWDEALASIAERLRQTAARAGGEAILPYHYGGSNGWLTEGALARRFFYRLGASRCLRTLCASATGAATRGLYGKFPGIPLEDYEHARLIVIWGCNPSASGIHLIPVLDRARVRGAKLIVVDPRATPLARRADLHLPVRPGADLPVALAMLSALFERGWADGAFLAAHARGVEELRTRAAAWSIPRAAEVAGVPAASVERFVELYHRASPAALRVGWGMERNRNGGSAVAAVLALPAVAGKFGVRGGGYTVSNGDHRWDVTGDSAIGEPEPGTRGVNMSQLARALRELRDPPVEFLFVYNANPVASTPNREEVRRQLAREDLFVVVHEQVMTETAALADVVLPATTFLEHRELRRGYGQTRMYDSPPVIAPVGEARSNNWLFGELLRRLDLVRPGDAMSDDELADAIFAAHPSGAALRAELVAHGVAVPRSGASPVQFVDVFPGTPDGKIDLCPEALDREAGGLYRYREDPGSAAYPLALISPAIPHQISSTFGSTRRNEVPVELHPDDAAARGIVDGDEVRVWNDLGEIRVRAQVTPETRPGVLVLPKGLWGHHTRNGANANTVVPEALADLGGQAAYNDARVQVARA